MNSKQSFLSYPLTTMLGSELLVRVLRELCFYGRLSVSLEMLCCRKGLAPNKVRSTLAKLVAQGIARQSGPTNQRVFCINDNHPLGPPLCSLFGFEAERTEEIFWYIRRSAENATDGAYSIWLHGSVARNIDAVGSDVEIGIIAPTEDLAELLEIAEETLENAAEKFVFPFKLQGFDPADVANLATNNDPQWQRCTEGAIPLAGDHPHEIARKLAAGEVLKPLAAVAQDKPGWVT